MAAILKVADKDVAILKGWLRAPTLGQGLGLRARVILASSAGEGVRAMARRLRLSPNTVCRWRRRYRRQGLVRRYPGREIHLICDNYGTHKHPKVRAWLAAHPRFHLHFTPTSASWLNLVERWFALITTQAIRRGSFDSTRRLEEAILRWTAHWNRNFRPFRWTKSAAEIKRSLANVTAICDTPHQCGGRARRGQIGSPRCRQANRFA